MSIELIIYLASLCDGITILFLLIVILGVVGLFGGWLDASIGNINVETMKLISRKSIPILSILCCMLVFVPSSKTCYLMLAAKYGQQTIQSPIFNKALKVIDKELDKRLNDK